MKFVKVLLWLIVTLFFLLALIWLACDTFPRYKSWHLLTKEKIKTDAMRYAHGYPVCLYEVDCASGEPKLTMIKSFDDFNLKQFKKRTMKRRLTGYCAGPTENLVLDFPEHLKSQAKKNQAHFSSARWSFFHDKFQTNNGHFQGSYVSYLPWEACTVSLAMWNSLPGN